MKNNNGYDKFQEIMATLKMQVAELDNSNSSKDGFNYLKNMFGI